MPQLSTILVLVVTAIAAVFDVKERRVPNKLVFPAICLALIYNLYFINIDRIIISLTTLVLLLLMYFIKIDLIGGGDVKLIFFVVLMMGMDVKPAIFLACLFTLPMITYFSIKEKKTQQKQYVPLALSIFLGLTANVVLGVILK